MNKLPGFGHLVAMAKNSTADFKVGACMQPCAMTSFSVVDLGLVHHIRFLDDTTHIIMSMLHRSRSAAMQACQIFIEAASSIS